MVDIQGKERVTGVTIAQVDEKSKPIPGTEEHIPCDTLLLSVGLIPENELSKAVGVELSPVTNGPTVNESLETSIPGVFACGNVLHVHDLVDYVLRGGSAGWQARRGLCPGRGGGPGPGNPPKAPGRRPVHRAGEPVPPAHGGAAGGALPGGAQHPGRCGEGLCRGQAAVPAQAAC